MARTGYYIRAAGGHVVGDVKGDLRYGQAWGTGVTCNECCEEAESRRLDSEQLADLHGKRRGGGATRQS